MNKFLEIYLSFLKIGSFTIGGGYVMIPLMQDLAVKDKKWCTEEEVLEYVTIAQSLPGMFGANVATNIGYKVGGLLGSTCAVLGMITPSLVIITAFASVYDKLMEIALIQNAFRGIQSAVLAILFLTALNLYKQAVKTNFQKFLLAVAILLTIFLNFSPFYLIISGIVIGIVHSIISGNKSKVEKE